MCCSSSSSGSRWYIVCMHSQFSCTHALRDAQYALRRCGPVICAHTHTHTCTYTQTHTQTDGTLLWSSLEILVWSTPQDDAEALVSEESKNTQVLSTSPPSSQESASEGEVEESEEAAATLHNIMVFDFPTDDAAKEELPGEESLSSVASASLGAESETAVPESTQSDPEYPQPPPQPPSSPMPPSHDTPPAPYPHDGECPSHESLISKLLSVEQSSNSLTGSVTSFDEDTSFVAPPPSFADLSTEVGSTSTVGPSFEGEEAPAEFHCYV